MRKIVALFVIVTTIVGLRAQTPADSILQTSAEADSAALQRVEPIIIEPLFEYPTAPDELKTIQERADWLMENLWKPFDFTKSSVSQAALDHAFQVYVTPLRWATPEVAEKQLDALIKTLSKYPPMLLQFTKAAENNLFSDRAPMWVDGAYMKFLDALMADKKIPELRKARYKEERKLLKNSLIGSKLPVFDYVTPIGEKGKLEFTTPYTVVIFGDPFCNECAMYKIAIESMPELASMIADEQLNIYYIIPDGESVEDWQRQLARYPSAWKRGAGVELDAVYDLRQQPSVYLLGADGTIINKFMTSEALKNYLVTNRPQNTTEKQQ